MKDTPMSVTIIVDETGFYHPHFIRDLLERLNDQKARVLVGLVTKTKKTNSIEYYLLRNLHRLLFKELLTIALKVIYYKTFKNLLCHFKIFLSVEAVLKAMHIDYFYVKNDINKPCYLQRISNFKPDIIISSCSVVFKKELLNIPRLGCINRHSALLPSYGGVYPVFNSIADGKDYSGVTIHRMTEKIDEGDILAQKKVPLETKNLSEIYSNCFSISTSLIFSALENLKQGKSLPPLEDRSYFSFPDKGRWKKFREHGGRFF